VHHQRGAQLVECRAVLRAAHGSVVVQHALDRVRIEQTHSADRGKSRYFAVDIVQVLRPSRTAEVGRSFLAHAVILPVRVRVGHDARQMSLSSDTAVFLILALAMESSGFAQLEPFRAA
jgi:hypothetical protein